MCNGGKIVFIANIPNEICERHIEHSHPIAESLCIFLLKQQGDVYTQGLHMRDAFVLPGCLWMARAEGYSLREAPRGRSV